MFERYSQSILTPEKHLHCENNSMILVANDSRDSGVRTAKEKFLLHDHPPIDKERLKPPLVDFQSLLNCPKSPKSSLGDDQVFSGGTPFPMNGFSKSAQLFINYIHTKGNGDYVSPDTITHRPFPASFRLKNA